MGASVHVDNKMAVFMRANEQAMERALERMGNDVFVLSQFKVPFLNGDLKNSGEHIRMGRLHRRVQYGESGAQGYASYQHRGMRKDGSRIVRNYTTSGTNKKFLEDSGKIIAPKSGQYFKREFESVRV
jgi:hypothetical protein